MEPVGILSEPISTLIDMIAETPSWQAWTNTTNPTDAAARIFMTAPDSSIVPDESVDIIDMPFCLVRWQAFDFHAIAGGTGLLFAPRHQLRLIVEDEILDDDRNTTSGPAYLFLNNLGSLISDLMEIAGEGGQLYIQTISSNGDILPYEESILGFPCYCFRADLTLDIGYN